MRSRHQSPASGPRPKGAPTSTNVFAMREALREGGGVIPDRVPPTDAPHLRRCVMAGLLVRLPGGGWVPTAAGADALREHDRARLGRQNPSRKARRTR